ncbi:MAG: hypothetical protein IIA66_01565 [Planctomycetes bacterium]|nr:hypothetical protein [Planctomycetota bacterium]
MATLESLLGEKLSEALQEVNSYIEKFVLRSLNEAGFGDLARSDESGETVLDCESDFDVLSVIYNLRATFRSRYEPVFQALVMDELDHPHAITLDDLCLGFSGHFKKKWSEFSETFDVFRSAMLALPSWRRSEPVMTATGKYAPLPTPLVLFQSSECQILLVGGLPVGAIEKINMSTDDDYRWINDNCLYAIIEGPFTAPALDRVSQQVRSVLRSLFSAFKEFDERPIKLVFDETGMKFAGCYKLIPDCLAAYFSDTPQKKKDSMDRRIRNAVHLLVEADRQEHDAVGLALCMSAAEALIGKKGPEIAGMIADSAATILEPELARRAAAVAKIKKLYNARSMLLHGSSVAGEPRARQEARLLASSLLIAMLERRKFVAAAGFDPETPDDLQREIQKLKFKPGQLTGVSDLAVRSLWQTETDAP